MITLISVYNAQSHKIMYSWFLLFLKAMSKYYQRLRQPNPILIKLKRNEMNFEYVESY